MVITKLLTHYESVMITKIFYALNECILMNQ